MIIVVYMLLTWHYKNTFAVNTWINGVYCTGKTIDEINSELLLTAKAPNITIKDKDGNLWEMKLEDINYSLDYTISLKAYIKKQNPWLWFKNAIEKKDNTVYPVNTYDEALLLKYWEELPFVKKEKQKPMTVSIEWTEDGYVLIDNLTGRLDLETSYEILKSAINDQKTTIIDLEKEFQGESLYKDVEPDGTQSRVLEQWKKVLEIQSLQITYDMGDEKLLLEPATLGTFLIRHEDGTFAEDENGKLSISEFAVAEFIKELADTYDTYGKERSFYATRGDWVTVPAGGTYGTLLNQKEETKYLYEALTKRVSEVHIPQYKRKPYHRGLNDLGDTYIEIDMTDQKMYFYLDGECLVDTDIVTGNTSRRWGTPEGVNYVYAMQRNRILRGANYASFVNYWMPVKGNIGIHDANWRRKFGSEIYKKDGSHGCINTPYKNMKVIYENVEVGVPVIMFY